MDRHEVQYVVQCMDSLDKHGVSFGLCVRGQQQLCKSRAIFCLRALPGGNSITRYEKQHTAIKKTGLHRLPAIAISTTSPSLWWPLWIPGSLSPHQWTSIRPMLAPDPNNMTRSEQHTACTSSEDITGFPIGRDSINSMGSPLPGSERFTPPGTIPGHIE